MIVSDAQFAAIEDRPQRLEELDAKEAIPTASTATPAPSIASTSSS
jgi:hypothetical protein